MISLIAEVSVCGPAYLAAKRIINAIDNLVGVLTGERTPFWNEGSTGVDESAGNSLTPMERAQMGQIRGE